MTTVDPHRDPVLAVRKAEAVVLAPDATGSEALLAVARECIAHWSANVDGVVDLRQPESLHQLRVGVRRFRSAVSLFRRMFEDDSRITWLSSEIRDLALPMGLPRDLDVLLAGDHVASLTTDQLAALRAARETAYDVVEETLASSGWRDAWRHVDRFLAKAPWDLAPDPPAREVAADALERRWRRVVQRGGRTAGLSAAEQHRLRIEAKKLRYGCQFFADLYPADSLALAHAVSRLQDALGEVNDAVVAGKRLAAVGAEPPRVDAAGLLAEAEKAVAGVAALPPFWR
ncbi:MAG TPA: CHAD domain-containing protein [Dermatophilaceae bacterium]|nr:CHAD domain-containing protein [Dermatophilaceae bacterium]